MRLQGIDNNLGRLLTVLAAVSCAVLVIGMLSACQNRATPAERPTLAVLLIEAQDTREETKDIADHLTKRFRTILSTRPEVRVLESRSAMHILLTGLDLARTAATLDADYLLTGTLSRGEGRMRLSLRLVTRSGDLLWQDSFESPLFLQAQLQEWVLDALWPQLPLDPPALESAKELIANCHYPDDGMAILTLARTGRRGGGPASLAMVATADIEAGLLHLAQSQFYFSQIATVPVSQRPVIERLAVRSLERAAANCPEHPCVELLRLLYTRDVPLDVENAGRFLARHPNSADLYLAVAELHAEAGSHRQARAYAREAAMLDPLGETTQCRTKALLEPKRHQESECR